MLRCFYCNCVFFSFFIWYFSISLCISSQFLSNTNEITLNQSTISNYDHKQSPHKGNDPLDITFFSMLKNQKKLKHCNGIACGSKEAKRFSRHENFFTAQHITDKGKHNMNTTLSTRFVNQTHGPARLLYVKNPNYEEFYIDISTTNDAIFSEFQLGEEDLKKVKPLSYQSNSVSKIPKKPFTESSIVDLRSNRGDDALVHKKLDELDTKPSAKSLKKMLSQNQLPLSTTSVSLKKKTAHSKKATPNLPRKPEAQEMEVKQQRNFSSNILVTTEVPSNIKKGKQHVQGMKKDLLSSLDHSNISRLNDETSDLVVKSINNPEAMSKTLHKDSVLDKDIPLLFARSTVKEDHWRTNEMPNNTEEDQTSQEEITVTNDISRLPKSNDKEVVNFLSVDKFKKLFYNFLNKMTPMDLASFFSGLNEKDGPLHEKDGPLHEKDKPLHEKRTEVVKNPKNNTIELFGKTTPTSILLSSTNTTSVENLIKDETPFISSNTYEMNVSDRGIFDNDIGHQERKDLVNVRENPPKPSSDHSALYEDDLLVKRVIEDENKIINMDLFATSQVMKNQSRVNISNFRTPKESVLKNFKNDKPSSKSFLSKSETPQSSMKVEVKNSVIDTQESNTNKSLSEISMDHGLLYENNILKFPSSTSLSSADACSLVLSFGSYNKKHVCCSKQNGIWWDPKIWSCKRTPSHQDVAVVLHRIELFDSNSTNVHIILNGLYILSTKSQQGLLSGGLPLWEICKTHLMSYAQNPSYQPQMYRYPWTFYNESLNEEFYDFFQKTLSIQTICLEFLGSHATHHRQSAKIYLVGQSVFCPSSSSLHNSQTNVESNSREFSIQSLLVHQCINRTNVLSSSHKSSKSPYKSLNKSIQPPKLVVGEHSGLLLFTNISIIMGDKGVIENSGTLFVGPSFVRHCESVMKGLLNSVNECAISSLLIFEGVSLLAYRPIRIARLEMNSFQTTHLSEQRNLQPQGKWLGSIGYPSWLPSADLSALIIHHGIQQLEQVGDYIFFSFKQLFIPGQTKETIVTFSVNNLQETHVKSISFFVDILISGNTLYQTQLIFNNISVKFSRYFEETLQIWGDILISAESVSIDRNVAHASSIQVKKPHLQHSLLRLMCTFFCDLNNKIYYGDDQERVQVVSRLS